MHRTFAVKSLFFAAVAVTAFAAGFATSKARDQQLVRFTPLLSTSKTILDETIVYPTSGPAKITDAIVALQPGEETGWHTHNGMPNTGIILEGELTVDYGDKGKKTFHQGDAIAEVMSIPHNGKNTGDGIMKLFVVYMGVEGVPVTVKQEK
jgi:quercetin dioxygenase-like cupin family protein